MDEIQAFDAYHRAFRPADVRSGVVFVARWWQGPVMGFQESERFSDRRDAARYADMVRRIYAPLTTGATVVAIQVDG